MAEKSTLVDNLSRSIEANVNLTNALNALAAAMAGGVKPVTSTTTVDDEIKDFLIDKGDKIKEFAKFLREDLPEAFTKMKEGMDEISSTIGVVKKRRKRKSESSSSGEADSSSELVSSIKGLDETIRELLGKGIPVDPKGALIPMVGEMPKNSVKGSIDENALKDLAKERLKTTKWFYALRNSFGNMMEEYISQLSDEKEIDAINKNLINIEKTLHLIDYDYEEINIQQRNQIRLLLAEAAIIGEKSNDINQMKKSYEAVNDAVVKIKRNLMIWKSIDFITTTFGHNKVKDFFQGALSGVMKDLKEWEVEATNMSATMTGTLLQAAKYRDILSVSNQTVRDTHMMASEIRKEWVKAIKKGTKSLQETKEVIESSLAGAWQIGASAESTSEEFQKWHMFMGMSKRGAISLARTMTSVAKSTGVMGDNLLKALQATEEIAQLMKDTGRYSQDAANATLGIMASAQKLGVDREIVDILKASQGGLEGFMAASGEMKNLLASAGVSSDVMGFNADPEQVMEGVGRAIKDLIPPEAFVGGNKTAGLPDLRKLNKETLSSLDVIMKNRFGMKLGRAVQVLQAIHDQDPAKKLEEVERELKSGVLTTTEKEALQKQKEQLTIAKSEKEISKSLTSFQKMSDILKMEGVTLERILEEGKFANKEDAIKNMNATIDNLEKKFAAQGKSLKGVSGKSGEDFKQELANAFNNIFDANGKFDKDKAVDFRELEMQLAKANRTADSEAKNNANNANKIESDMQTLNNNVQTWLAPIATALQQLPTIAIYALALLGTGRLLYRYFSKGQLTENMQATAHTLLDTIGTKGSGWVHDPYVEHFVKNIDKNIFKMARKLGVSDAKRVREKTDNSHTKLRDVYGIGLNNILDKVTDKLGMFGGVIDTVRGGFHSLKDNVLGLFGAAKGGISGIAGSILPEGMVDKIKNNVKTTLSKGVSVLSPVEASDAAKISKDAVTSVVKGPQIAAKAPDLKPNMTSGGDTLIKGAAKLTAIAAGVVALGVVLIGATKFIMSMTGFDAKQAKEVATVLGVVIGAGAGALLAAAGAAKLMEIANKMITIGTMRTLALGGLKLLGMMAALMVLGGAILAFGYLTSFFVTPKEAKEYASLVVHLLGATALIAFAVVGATAGLAILGLFATQAWWLVPLLLGGAGALLTLTPAMIGLSKAVMYIASESMKWFNIDPAEVSKTAKLTAKILMYGAMIAGSVLAATGFLTSLGTLSIAAPLLLPVLIAGAGALYLLTPGILKFTKVIIDMTKELNKGYDIEGAEKTAQLTAKILLQGAKIAGVILAATGVLTSLGTLAVQAPILVPALLAGGAALYLLTPAILWLAKSIIKFSEESIGNLKEEDIKKIAGSAETLIRSAGQIANSILISSASLAVFSGFYLILSGVIWAIKTGSEILTKIAPTIIDLAGSVIDLVEGSKTTKKIDVTKSKNAAKDISEVFESSSKIIEALDKSQKYFTGTSLLGKIFGSIASIFKGSPLSPQECAKKITKMLDDTVTGIIAPITTWFGNKENSSKIDANTAENAKKIGEVFQSAGQILDTLGKAQGFLQTKSSGRTWGEWFASWGSSSAEVDTEGTAKGITSMLNNIITGIVTPISQFSKVGEIQTATNSLRAVDSALTGLMEVMKNISETMSKIGSIGINFSALEGVGGVFKSGKLELTISPKGGGFKAGETDSTSDDIKKLISLFSTGTGSPLVNSNNNFFRSMRSNFGQGIEQPISGVRKSTDAVGKNVDDLGKSINPTKSLEKIAINTDNTVAVLLRIETILNNITTSFKDGSISIKCKCDCAKSVVDNKEFENQMQIRIAQISASPAMKQVTEHLSNIAVNTAETVTEIKKTNKKLDEIKEEIKSNKGSVVSSGNSGPRPLFSMPNTFAWRSGSFASSDVKQGV